MFCSPLHSLVLPAGSLPMKVVWVRNNKILPNSKDFHYQENSNGVHSLVVRDIFPEDAGVYICEAYNAHGEAHCYCRLSVHGEFIEHFVCINTLLYFNQVTSNVVPSIAIYLSIYISDVCS